MSEQAIMYQEAIFHKSNTSETVNQHVYFGFPLIYSKCNSMIFQLNKQ